MPDPTTPPAAGTVTADLITAIRDALDVPDAASARDIPTEDRLRLQRITSVQITLGRILAGDISAAAAAESIRHATETFTVTYQVAGLDRDGDGCVVHGEAPCCAPLADDPAQCAGPRAGAEVVRVR